jgi:hypothetical protein
MLRLAQEQGLESTLRRIASIYDEATGAKGDVEETIAEQLLKSFADEADRLSRETLFRRALDNLAPTRR